MKQNVFYFTSVEDIIGVTYKKTQQVSFLITLHLIFICLDAST